MSSNEAAMPDPGRRRLLVNTTSAVGGLAVAAAAYPFVASLAPSERARAQGAPVEADADAVALGALATAEWRGKPVWILRRTPDMLARLASVRAELTDADSEVAQQPDYAPNPRDRGNRNSSLPSAYAPILAAFRATCASPARFSLAGPGASTAHATARSSTWPD